MKKVKFIYNPAAGEKSVTDRLDRIIELYQSRGMEIVPWRLDFSRPAAEMLGGVDGTFDHILIAGGDGTVNYVVNAMKGLSVELPVAVLAAGTANDFANAFGVPSNPEKAVEAILDGEIRAVDLGVVNGRRFVNICSSGLFTGVSQSTPTSMKNVFGRLAYLAGGARELANYHKIGLRIESDGGDFEGEALVLLVFNGKTAGNFKLARMSELDDGLLDVLIIKGDNPIETFHTVFMYISGITRGKDYPRREVVHLKCSRLTVWADSSEATDIDGQPGPGFPLDICCERGGIRVITPRGRTRGARRRTPVDL